MSPILIGFLGIVFMFVLILFQVPIGISMIVVGLLGFGVLAGFGSAASILSTEFISKISSTDNLVLPLFLLMGTFSSVAGLSGDIYRLANAVIGHRRGGLAVGTVVGCGFFRGHLRLFGRHNGHLQPGLPARDDLPQLLPAPGHRLHRGGRLSGHPGSALSPPGYLRGS